MNHQDDMRMQLAFLALSMGMNEFFIEVIFFV